MAETYRVTGQRQVHDVGQGGRLIDALEIDYLTASGAEGSIRVPVDAADPDVVRALIERRVAMHDAIAEL